MKFFVFAIMLLLVGCSTTKIHLPEAPPELFVSCPELKQVPDDNIKITVLIDTVAENYAKYHECKIRNTAWQQWYNQQKQLIEIINK
jgi:uncharacterized protein YfaA (DUF2138 family)